MLIILHHIFNTALLIYFTPSVTSSLMVQQDPPVSKRYRQATVYTWYALLPVHSFIFFKDYPLVLTFVIFWFYMISLSEEQDDNSNH